ncbi:hypothetical protein SRHO_G00019490 [Serrasalmus rhombeus]
MTVDPVPIKSWADMVDKTEGNINQTAEIEALKKDTPENETKRDQKKNTRRGTRGKEHRQRTQHLKLILISRGGHRERRRGKKHIIGQENICRRPYKPLLRKRVLHRKTSVRREKRLRLKSGRETEEPIQLDTELMTMAGDELPSAGRQNPDSRGETLHKLLHATEDV